MEHRFRSEKSSEKISTLSHYPHGLPGTIIDVMTDVDLQGRLMGMGLFIGTRFQLLRGGHMNTPLILAIGETRIAIDNRIAEMILVER